MEARMPLGLESVDVELYRDDASLYDRMPGRDDWSGYADISSCRRLAIDGSLEVRMMPGALAPGEFREAYRRGANAADLSPANSSRNG